MTTTPDYAGLIERLESIPTKWVDGRLGKEAATALRTLLERNAALERERTNLIEAKREQIGRLQKERDEQWKRADTLAQQNAYHKDRAEEVEAERDRLAERVAALERVVERFEQHGCPDCSGDCSAANPPVLSCIMQEARTARSLVKGGVDGR